MMIPTGGLEERRDKVSVIALSDGSHGQRNSNPQITPIQPGNSVKLRPLFVNSCETATMACADLSLLLLDSPGFWFY